MKSISNLDQHGFSGIWQAAENYLQLGSDAYKIEKVEGNKINISPTSDKPNWVVTILKVISFAIAILPLAALCIIALYRRCYDIQVARVKPIVSQPQEATPPPVTDPVQNNNTVLKTLQKAKQQGKKIGLCIGRSETEAIPANSDKWIWVSVDPQMKNPPLENRLHLKETAENLAIPCAKFFDKIICDLSTLKFFSSPWDLFHGLLDENPDSELITQRSTGVSKIRPNRMYDGPGASYFITQKEHDKSVLEKLYAFSKWKDENQKVASEELEKFASKNFPKKDLNDPLLLSAFREHFLNHIYKPEGIDHLKELDKVIEKYLKHLFHDVKLKQGHYPLRDKKEGEIFYWQVKSPKPDMDLVTKIKAEKECTITVDNP